MRSVLAMPVLFALLVLLAVLAFHRPARAHDPYSTWSPPGNPKTSCCSNADCRPTRAYLDDDGRWRAWNGTLWLIVPWERVLPTNLAGDGRSHLCEKEQFIYCFSPGEVRG